MTRTTQTLKRLGVAGIAIATIGAGVPALIASGASAATSNTANLTINPPSQTGAAGTCLAYKVTATDASGGNTNGTPTVTITITQNPAQGATATTPQNISFCNPDATTSGTASNTSTPAPNGSAASPTTPASQSMDFSTTQASSTSPATATFGVRSDQPGGIAIRATTGSVAAGTQVTSAQATATYTAGGNGQAANNAVTKLTDVSTSTQQSGGFVGGSQTFRIKATDANGNPVPNAQVSFQDQSGANGPASGTAPTNQNCGTLTDNNGVASCSVAVTKSGTDTFLFFVNQNTSSGQQTSGPDAGEPQLTVTRTTAPAPNTNTAEARNITVTPTSTTTAAGATRTFTAHVVDASGRAVQGVFVQGTINGPGRFTGTTNSASNNTQFAFEATNGFGDAVFTTTTFSTESGTQVVTFTIANSANGSNQCNSSAGTPSTATTDGNCTAVASNVIGAASPSPSATSTVSPSPSSSSPAPSQSSTPAGVRKTLTLNIDTPVITAGQQGTLTVTGAASQIIQLECYSRPASSYTPSHRTTIDAAGDPVVFKLALGGNTRCFAEYVTNSAQGASNNDVINVKAGISLFPVRKGFRNYVFQGHNLPKATGQLITLYYVTNNGSSVRKGNVKTDASGIYYIPVKFVSNGTFTFYVRSGQTLNNAAGESNRVSVNVH